VPAASETEPPAVLSVTDEAGLAFAIVTFVAFWVAVRPAPTLMPRMLSAGPVALPTSDAVPPRLEIVTEDAGLALTTTGFVVVPLIEIPLPAETDATPPPPPPPPATASQLTLPLPSAVGT